MNRVPFLCSATAVRWEAAQQGNAFDGAPNLAPLGRVLRG
jgi:hypothetical protein